MDSEEYFSPLTRLIDYYTKSLYKNEDGSTHLSIECHSLLLHIAGIRNKNKLELFLIDMMPKEKKLFYFGGKMSLLSYKIEPKTTTSSGVYKVETQYTVEDGVVSVSFEVPAQEVDEKIKKDGFFNLEQEQESICAYTKEGRVQVGTMTTQKRVALSQINFDVPENRKFYSYEDALIFYKKKFEKEIEKNKQLKEILHNERVKNQKVNTKYKKVVNSLNRLVGQLLKG